MPDHLTRSVKKLSQIDWTDRLGSVYDVCMTTTHITSDIEIAGCPADGGKWVIYCDHFDADKNPIGTGLLQDTNKERLARWRNHSDQWCPLCQEGAQ